MAGDQTPPPALITLRVGERIRVFYTNWRGKTDIREIDLIGVPLWGQTQWHPEPQWLISGIDVVKNETRMWAVKDMRPVT